MLIVHRAERADALADALAVVLAAPLDDPFAAELVAVPARGVERWLAQRLSHRLGAAPDVRDGVCANVTFPSPHRLLRDTTAAAAPQQALDLERWTPRRLTGPLLGVIDESVGEDWARVLRRHLYRGGQPGPQNATGRRLSLAGRLARLFHSYARDRPGLLDRWEQGHAVLPDGTPLDRDEQWQPLLWDRLRTVMGGTSPVRLAEQVRDAVRSRPELLRAPERLSVFGPSRLSRSDVDLLAALAEHRDVHLWLHHASPALWRTVEAAGPVRRRADDRLGARLANPLLGSLSRDVRELQQLLREHAPDHTSRHHPGPPPSPADDGTSLLARLRDDLAHDRVPAVPPALAAGDRSVQVHACHGRTRQVEVLREVVVGLLADDPTLQARDVLVMCPDVETFAPLLAAAFSSRGTDDAGPAEHPAARLRVRVADRALHQANPLLAVLDRLLDLGSARLTATEVLDLAGHPAVARRFALDDDDLERLRGWTSEAGARWGLHPQHRAAWQLQHVPDGTWRRGLDRVLLGAAVEPGSGGTATSVDGLVPLDDVDSSDILLAGRFAELLDRLDTAHAGLAEAHDATGWAELLEQVVLRLAAPEPRSAWQQLQLREVLDEALLDVDPDDPPAGPGAVPAGAPGVWPGAAAGPAAARPLLSLSELRPVLRGALGGRPSKAGFRTGALTVCTLVPMRSVPHRVVVLLGLDDGAFPRQTVRDGDDLLARDPWVGDRDPRSEDRQLLLDAVCAAGGTLVVLYTGADERTGARVPPAVPLGELLDALDRTAAAPDGRRVRDVVTTRHPLQPFDARNFTPGRLGAPGVFSFDAGAHAGALAARGPRQEPVDVTARPLPPLAPSDVALGELVRLLVDPAKGFLRQRLQISLAERDGDPDDALPTRLDSLQEWGVGDRMLRDRLAGLAPPLVMTLERGRGALPPGPLGGGVLQRVGPRVDALAAAVAPWHGLEAESVDVDVDLGDGTRLTGTVGGLRGDRLVAVAYSSLGPKHRLTAWLQLLALSVGRPHEPWQAVTLGRGSGRDRDSAAVATVAPVGPTQARRLLLDLVQLYRSGLEAPLPLPLKTGEAYATQRSRGRRVSSARFPARQQWEGSARFPGERAAPEQALLRGDRTGFEDLLAEPARAVDLVDGGPADEEGDRFGVLARRLWEPLLHHETTGAP